jgi:hypothetical protein
MHEFYLISGIVLIVVIGYDFFYTTLSFSGAGYLSRLMSRLLSALFLLLNRYIPHRKALRYSGVTHILSLIGLWIGLLWIGFFLLLMSDPDSVVEAGSGFAASTLTKLYVSGYTLSTLGVGDYIPGTERWQITMAAFSFVGFIFITTTMTYLMSLSTAVIHKRNLSLFIANMGVSPEEIVANSYHEERFAGLRKVAPTLREMINKHNQNHFAHPAMHYFYSRFRPESISINLTNLDEALSIIFHLGEKPDSADHELRALRKAIDSYLDSIGHNFFTPVKHDMEHTPDFETLQERDIISVSRQTPEEYAAAVADRRTLLTGLLQSDGWSWQNIYSRDT